MTRIIAMVEEIISIPLTGLPMGGCYVQAEKAPQAADQIQPISLRLSPSTDLSDVVDLQHEPMRR
jgi:hypothetical protein